VSELERLEELVARLDSGRLDVGLEFRRQADGTKSGRVVVRDPSGRTLADLSQESPEAMTAALARLVVLGFTTPRDESTRATPAQQPPVPARRATADVLVAGVDGYRKGWVAVALDPSGDVQVSTHPTFAGLLASRAQVIAVDIPIDPAGRGSRPADAAARAFVRGRASSVFSTPPRAALEADSFAEACEIARSITGKGISQQAFALGRKILEVHQFAEGDERLLEMHPEVSFCALAGSPLGHSKHTFEGLALRRDLLSGAGIDVPAAYPGVPEIDLLDAAVGAWTAARYASGGARSFPPEHTERLGAIWA
jgi:predicted RNase H-like nuclease